MHDGISPPEKEIISIFTNAKDIEIIMRLCDDIFAELENSFRLMFCNELIEEDIYTSIHDWKVSLAPKMYTPPYWQRA